MAALCRTRACTSESHFLRLFFFSRQCRGAGTENGSGSESSEFTECRTHAGGFASALERQSELQHKQELGRKRVRRRCCARDAAGGKGVGRNPAWVGAALSRAGPDLCGGAGVWKERGFGGVGLRYWAGPGVGIGTRIGGAFWPTGRLELGTGLLFFLLLFFCAVFTYEPASSTLFCSCLP